MKLGPSQPIGRSRAYAPPSTIGRWQSISKSRGWILGLLAPLPLCQAQEEVVLPRVPPTAAADAATTFQLADGFAIELVASEPLVCDPIAMEFDPQGRMVVVEMIDYSEQDKEHLGRIRRLEDTNGDGTMDRSEVLVERLSWPTALALAGNKIWVVAPPQMTAFDATRPFGDATFRPDQGELLLDGFGRDNVQGLANSFRWGLDQRWHLSTSTSGGQLSGALSKNPLAVRGRDIAIDPQGAPIETTLGGGQHGMDFTSWGDKLVSSNSDHLQQVLGWEFPALQQTPLSSSFPWRRSIAVDGPQADVYRLSPVEAWRQWRTHLRVTGQFQGIIEGNGRAAGYFTGATGVLFFDGDQWGETPPTALVSDVGGNLVHRKQLSEDGLWWQGRRVDAESELVRSSDIWFRPVQLANGPDGTLYLLDMYREVIEHPASLPPPIKKQTDLTSGRDRGRIWRVRRSDRPIRRTTEDLSALSPDDLARRLDHPNGWHRETASRLLYQQLQGGQLSDRDAIESIRVVATAGNSPEGRLAAASLLAALPDGLDNDCLEVLLDDPHPAVRFRTLASLHRIDHPDWMTQLLASRANQLASDPNPKVRFAAAAASQKLFPDLEVRLAFLKEVPLGMWEHAPLRAAVEASLGSQASQILDSWLKAHADSLPDPWIDAAVYQTLLAGGPVPLLDLHSQLQQTDRPQLASRLQGSIARLFPRAANLPDEVAKARFALWRQEQVVQPIAKQLSEQSASPQLLASASLIATLPSDQLLPLRTMVLSADAPIAWKRAAMEQGWFRDETGQDQLVDGIASLPPELIPVAVRSLLQRPASIARLLDQIDSSKLSADQIPGDAWSTITSQKDAQLATRGAKLRGATQSIQWESIATDYRTAWRDPGVISAGKELFQKHCASCHRIHGIGQDIGPALGSLAAKANDQIALSVAEPSREVDPRYQVFQAVTTDQQVVVGILLESNDQAVVLKTAQGKEERIERTELEQLTSSGKSLMPEGLLPLLNPQQFRDLLDFLRRGEEVAKTK
ncbi:MAG: PVC-type heme-binding CxxCH protein [Pirellulaceae bacterium]